MPPQVADGHRHLEEQLFHSVASNVGEDVNQDISSNRTAHQSNQSSSSKVPFLDRLRAIPIVRPIPWRPGQELPPEKSSESPRVQQRGATMLSSRGVVMEDKCEHCALGYGRFSLCITLGYYYQGACAGCIFTSKGNKCSLRFQTSGTADGRALRYYTDDPEALQSYIRNAPEKPVKGTRKRKRRPDSKSEPSNAAGQLHGSPDSPDEDSLLQAQIANESFGQQDIMDDDDTRIRKKPAHMSHHSDEPQRPAANLSTPRVPASITGAVNAFDAHVAAAAPRQDGFGNFQNPSTVIDAVPRAKERQIIGIISGLQGGISRMHENLNAFKSLLGIDPDNARASRR